MTPRRAASIRKTRIPLCAYPVHPLVAALSRDLVQTAELCHREIPALKLLYELPALVHYSAHSPGHVLFYRPCCGLKCQPCPRSKVSTMSPVCTQNEPTP